MSGINLGEGEEMMRNLLRSADRTREATTPMQNRPAPDQELRDLASLIGSLDIDLTKTVTKERPKHVAADTRSEVFFWSTFVRFIFILTYQTHVFCIYL